MTWRSPLVTLLAVQVPADGVQRIAFEFLNTEQNLQLLLPIGTGRNTKGYSSTYLALEFANVWAGTFCRDVFGYPPEHKRIP